MSDEEKARVTAELAKDGIVPVFLTYRRFGAGAMALWGWYFARLLALIVSSGWGPSTPCAPRRAPPATCCRC